MTSSGISSLGRDSVGGARSDLAAGPTTCQGATADAFVSDVVEAYADATGSASVFRFLQLRARLKRAVP